MFALGYYAGCRASDVCWFRLDQVHHLTKKSGHITVGYKGKQGARRMSELIALQGRCLCTFGSSVPWRLRMANAG